MGWKDTIKVAANKENPAPKSWRDTIVDIDQKPGLTIPKNGGSNPEISKTESGLFGTAKGLTYGTVDEVVGGVRGFYDDMKKMFTGDKSGPTVKYDQFGRVANADELNKAATYEKHRDAYRASEKAAEQANPGTFFAGDMAGSVASSFIPGLNALNVAKGEKLGTTALKLGSQGFISGAGRSDADTVQGVLFDAGKDALLSTGSGLALNKVGDFAKWATKQGGKIVLGVPTEASEHYLKNMSRVDDAKPLGEITQEFLEKVDDIRGNLSQQSSESFQELIASGKAVPKSDFSKHFRGQIEHLQGLGVYGPEREKSIRVLEKFADNIDNVQDPLVGLDKGKSIIVQLDAVINGLEKRPDTDTQVLRAFQNVRKGINNFLRDEVPTYAAKMDELAEDTRKLTELSKRFRTAKGAQDLLKRVQTGKDDFASSGLKEFDTQFGTNYTDKLKDSFTKDAFRKDATRGSRNTVLGAIVGKAAGTASGLGTTGLDEVTTAIGGAIGQSTDRIGGTIYKNLLKAGKLAEPYLKILERASQNGKLPIIHELLTEHDDVYREILAGRGQSQNQSIELTENDGPIKRRMRSY